MAEKTSCKSLVRSHALLAGVLCPKGMVKSTKETLSRLYLSLLYWLQKELASLLAFIGLPLT